MTQSYKKCAFKSLPMIACERRKVESPSSMIEAKNLPDFHRSLRLETVFLTLNESRPPFDNLLVRQAFSRAVDRKGLVAAAYRNFANPTTAQAGTPKKSMNTPLSSPAF